MAKYYPMEMQSSPMAVIRRERLLPARGEVLAHPGDWVVPADVVARCALPGKVWAVDVGKALGIQRERAEQYVRQGIGDAVQADDVLAERKDRFGWQKRRCLAPVDGHISDISDGVILIETAARSLELCAHFKGKVTEIVPGRGVVISAVGAWIQALWGSGGQGVGPLRTMVDDPAQPLTADSFKAKSHDGDAEDGRGHLRGVLVVGGRIADARCLELAVEAQVKGLIVGSVDAGLCQRLQHLPYPVLLLEGFGALTMRQEAFALLQANEGREAILSAENPAPRWYADLPEVLIPLDAVPDAAPTAPTPRPLQIGVRVRALRAPYQGAVGTVTRLPVSPHILESGIRLPVAEVELDEGKVVSIPLANLEFSR